MATITMDTPKLRRALSTNTGKQVMADVSEVASRVFRESELPRLGFEVGVVNTLVKAMVFAGAPQFLWLYALIEYPILLVLIARSWYRRNMLLYFAEFCWVANTLGFMYLAFEAVNALQWKGLDGSLDTVLWMGPSLRLSAAHAFFAIANGPLAMTILMNANALVFHDVERTAGVFIHLTPALVSWTMRWRFTPAAASCAQPDKPEPLAFLVRMLSPSSAGKGSSPSVHSLFALDHASEFDVSQDLLYLAVALYLAWWLGYAAWLLTIGYDLPRRGWGASSFNDLTPAIAKLYKVPPSKPRAQALAYLFSHAVAVTLMLLVLPPIFYHSYMLHTAFLALLALSTIHQGARYYHHVFGRKMAKALQQAIEAELVK